MQVLKSSSVRSCCRRPAATPSARTPAVSCRAAAAGPSTSSSSDSQQAFSRRSLFFSALAASALVTLPQPRPARAADIAEQAIDELAELESKGKVTAKSLEDFRNKYKFKRGIDGRVQLKGARGEWFTVRLDMEVPGAMLLRDSKGYIYAIQTETMQQIDLSDDQVILLMFADGDWESQMSPIEFSDENGKVKQLKMDDKDFRSVVGLLKVTQQEEEAQ